MSWKIFTDHYLSLPELDFSLDLSRMGIPDGYAESLGGAFEQAFKDMRELEGGAIANPDENRMVGHYWLRNPDLAPDPAVGCSIREEVEHIKDFSRKVYEGELEGQSGTFTQLLVIGIGGSALGPQFVAQALSDPKNDPLKVWFFDNTDPDGIDFVLDQLGGKLGRTLCLVISKSGGTPETRNGMLEAAAAYHREGLDFAKHAVAVTGEGSKLDAHAREEGWLARFPMWDWVGGRTSETATVGLLPAALQGFDIDGMLEGAAAMDDATRVPELKKNPAALMAMAWFHATNGKGEKDMVVLPYKDRLGLLAKYLQQLIMESLGKEKDLHGNTVHQGIAVYGNKGSTDQHAYVQQLREGVANFFAVFIEVLRDRKGESMEVEEGVTAGDFLQGFLLGTREALSETGRPSLTITIKEVSAESVGQLIALFERAVGFYASIVGINAYHQPGVEAGKKAAAGILDLKRELIAFFRENSSGDFSVAEIAGKLNRHEERELIFKLLDHLRVNRPDLCQRVSGGRPEVVRFSSGSLSS